MKINEKTQIALKIFGIWWIVTFISYFVFWFLFAIGNRNLKSFLEIFVASIGFTLLSPLAVLLIFAPAIVTVYFLFKKVKDSLTRIYLIAFIIPFTNLIYLLIEHYFIFGSDGMMSMFIGFFILFMFLPLTLITTCFIPKVWLPLKKDMITTQLLLITIGWIMVVLSGFLINISDNIVNSIKINKYNSIIESLEHYKTEHNRYPSQVEDTVKCYKNFEYKTEDNSQEYVLMLYNSPAFLLNYCSSDKLKECKLGYHNGRYNRKFGKWVKSVYND